MLLYQAVRFQPKSFRQRRPNGQDGWDWSVKGVRRVLYRLTALQGKKTVFIPEGERDADRLADLGLTATTNAGGAGKWRDEYTKQLTAAGVQRAIVIPDNDDAGIAHARAVATSCHAAGIKIKLLTLPVAAKGDVSSYLTDHGKDDLLALVKDAPLYEPASARDTGASAPGATPSSSDEPPDRYAVFLRLSDVEREEVSWHWPGRTARGQEHCRGSPRVDGHRCQSAVGRSLA